MFGMQVWWYEKLKKSGVGGGWIGISGLGIVFFTLMNLPNFLGKLNFQKDITSFKKKYKINFSPHPK